MPSMDSDGSTRQRRLNAARTEASGVFTKLDTSTHVVNTVQAVGVTRLSPSDALQ